MRTVVGNCIATRLSVHSRRVAAVAVAVCSFLFSSSSFAQSIDVAPDDSSAVSFAGVEGGPFSAKTLTTWTLDNLTGDDVAFAVSADQQWIVLSRTDGVLPGSAISERTRDVTVTLDATEAAGLAPGIYTATIMFRNLESGEVDAERSVRLEIAPAGIAVSPAFVVTSATRGGADPAAATISVESTGGVDLNYEVSWQFESWVTPAKVRGTAPGGGSDSFNLVFNIFGLSEGTYSSIVSIENTTNGLGSRDIPVTLIVMASGPGTVRITPNTDLVASGAVGLIPEAAQTLVLENLGDDEVVWSATADAPWITISPASGVLSTAGIGKGQTVQVRMNAARNDVPAGSHSAVISFKQLITQPVTGVVNEVPLESRIARIVANPVLTVSVPLVGGSVEVNPGDVVVAGGDKTDLVRSFGSATTLTAVVENGFDFAGWTANFAIDDPLENPLVVTMDASHDVSAVFTPIHRTLSLGSSGTGTGSISTDPTGFQIDNGLVSRYNNGSSVSLTASADAGSVFVGWLGNIPPGDELKNPLEVVMDRDRTISAGFEAGVGLAVDVTGAGRVDVIPDLLVYEVGAEVTLVAQPNEGNFFVEWTGGVTGTSASVTLTLTDSIEVHAIFEEGDNGNGGGGSPQDPPDDPNSAKLTVQIDGSGSVTPPSGSYAIGAEVTLIASPEIGFAFTGWTGDATGSDLVTVVTMDGNKSVTASFQETDEPAGQPVGGGSGALCGATGMISLSIMLLGLVGIRRFGRTALRT